MLRLDEPSKTFGAVAAVDPVILEIPEGQMDGIIGRSGAGKSTLLRLIDRMADPSSGRIAFDGVDVGSLAGRRLLDWRAQSQRPCCADGRRRARSGQEPAVPVSRHPIDPRTLGGVDARSGDPAHRAILADRPATRRPPRRMGVAPKGPEEP